MKLEKSTWNETRNRNISHIILPKIKQAKQKQRNIIAVDITAYYVVKKVQTWSGLIFVQSTQFIFEKTHFKQIFSDKSSDRLRKNDGEY